MISRCNSPIPEIRDSPVSSLISILRDGSSFPTCLKISISFGRSCVFFAAIDFVTTVSNRCVIASKGSIGLTEIVSPTSDAIPAIAKTFPAEISSTCSGLIHHKQEPAVFFVSFLQDS
jgi:hypothetical protein